MAAVLMVIAPETFRDEEYEHPKQVLEAHVHTVTTASTRPGLCTGKLGAVATAEISIEDALERSFDAVVFVGGAGASVYFDDEIAHRLARRAHERDAVVAAICIAPSILARAGLLQGVRATAYPTQEQDLKDHGAVWTGEDVTVDGRIVTANGPHAAVAFGEAIARSLCT